MKEIAGTLCIYVGIVAAIWLIGVAFSNAVSDYEIIAPTDGINCVVVSRMFNTSVDCWKTN